MTIKKLTRNAARRLIESTVDATGLGLTSLGEFIGVAPAVWMRYWTGARSLPRYVQYSLEVHRMLAETNRSAFAALVASRSSKKA